FLLYKLNTVPTNYDIPKAILLKFNYRDSAFFKTFTNKKNIIPAHQIEFNDLLQNAIKSYKLKNNITLTDKETRDLIQTKLCQKLITNYLSNLNFRPLKLHQTYQILKYCRNFIKTILLKNPKIILDIIYQVHTSLYTILSE